MIGSVKKKDWKKHALECASFRVLKSQRHCLVHPTSMPRPIPLPASDQCCRCGYCGVDCCLKRLKKCAGCGCIWYCGQECQKKDWKKHSLQCVTFRAKKWQCRLLLAGTELPERLVHRVVDYAVVDAIVLTEPCRMTAFMTEPCRTRRVNRKHVAE